MATPTVWAWQDCTYQEPAPTPPTATAGLCPAPGGQSAPSLEGGETPQCGSPRPPSPYSVLQAVEKGWLGLGAAAGLSGRACRAPVSSRQAEPESCLGNISLCDHCPFRSAATESRGGGALANPPQGLSPLCTLPPAWRGQRQGRRVRPRGERGPSSLERLDMRVGSAGSPCRGLGPGDLLLWVPLP